MKFRKNDGGNDSAMVLLAYMEGLTDIQRNRIMVLITRITDCEDSMPGTHWCDACRDTWKKIWSVALKFKAQNKRKATHYEKLIAAFAKMDLKSAKGDMFKPYERGDIL